MLKTLHGKKINHRAQDLTPNDVPHSHLLKNHPNTWSVFFLPMLQHRNQQKKQCHSWFILLIPAVVRLSLKTADKHQSHKAILHFLLIAVSTSESDWKQGSRTCTYTHIHAHTRTQTTQLLLLLMQFLSRPALAGNEYCAGHKHVLLYSAGQVLVRASDKLP